MPSIVPLGPQAPARRKKVNGPGGVVRYVEPYALPVYRQVSHKAHVDSILVDHAAGYFRRPAEFVDEVLTDDRIFGVLQTRIGALLSSELEIKEARGRRKERQVAEAIGGTDDRTGLWSEMVSPGALFDLMKWGLMLGVAVAEIVWVRSPGEWRPRLVPWHPQFLRWDWGRARFVLQAADGREIVLPRPDEQPDGDGQWFVWVPKGPVCRGWLNGLVRCLGEKYIMRQWDYRDWARWCERAGQGIIKGKVPSGAKDVEKDAFIEQLGNLGNESAVLLPQGGKDEGGFDVELEESMAQNWQSFEQFKKQLDVDIAILILGQNLTTEVTDRGARSAAEVHDLVRLDKALEDAGVGDPLRRQLLAWYTLFNRGDRELAPLVKYHVEPATDLVKLADGWKRLGEAVTSLTVAEPRVDGASIIEEQGVPLLTEEELEAAEAMAAQEEGDEPPPGGQGGEPEGEDDNEPPPTGGQEPSRARAALSNVPVVRRFTFAGLPIAIEHPAGSIRIFRRPDGREDSVKMQVDYGFIDGYLSGDGEQLDVYMGGLEAAPDVYVVHQQRAPEFKAHDEDKCFLGFGSADDAKACFLYHRGEAKAFGGMSVIPLERFKAKLRRRGAGTQSKIRASAGERGRRADVTAALLRLAKRAGSPKRKVAAPKKQAAYQERLRERAQALAARALAVDLADLRAEIDKASSFDDLRARIVARFRKMNPDRLAEVIRKANILAHLSGQLDAINEV